MNGYSLKELTKDVLNPSRLIESPSILSSGYIYPNVPTVGKYFTCGSFKTPTVLKVNSRTGVFETRSRIFRLYNTIDVEPVKVREIDIKESVVTVEAVKVVETIIEKVIDEEVPSAIVLKGDKGDKGDDGVDGVGVVLNLITSYRSNFEIDLYIYVGYLKDGLPIIKRRKDGVDEVGQGVVDLEADWINRLILTYV